MLLGGLQNSSKHVIVGTSSQLNLVKFGFMLHCSMAAFQ